MSVDIAVVDYGAGNLRSIRRALEAAGATVSVTAYADTVLTADAVVFPVVMRRKSQNNPRPGFFSLSISVGRVEISQGVKVEPCRSGQYFCGYY